MHVGKGQHFPNNQSMCPTAVPICATFPQKGECHLQNANPTDVANHPSNSDRSFLLHCANFALLPGVLRRKGVD
jgi:radical SAM superfamily enzyme with C-terminal helix-hairpin-helix motif